jgi:hypothetical protein
MEGKSETKNTLYISFTEDSLTDYHKKRLKYAKGPWSFDFQSLHFKNLSNLPYTFSQL